MDENRFVRIFNDIESIKCEIGNLSQKSQNHADYDWIARNHQ